MQKKRGNSFFILTANFAHYCCDGWMVTEAVTSRSSANIGSHRLIAVGGGHTSFGVARRQRLLQDVKATLDRL